MPSTDTLQAEIASIEVQPHGESFVLGLVAENRDALRIELPGWAVHQLMRLLPRLDAALLQERDQVTSELIAYPVEQWSVERTGVGREVALSVRTDRRVESALLFEGREAVALHAALGKVLANAPVPIDALSAPACRAVP